MRDCDIPEYTFIPPYNKTLLIRKDGAKCTECPMSGSVDCMNLVILCESPDSQYRQSSWHTSHWAPLKRREGL